MNILGQNIETLLQGDYSAGSYKKIWNAANLAAGFYFYRLKIDYSDGGNASSIKKMLLLK